MKALSHKILDLAPSVTVSLDSLAKEMQARGEDIINLTSGEPKEASPEQAKKNAIKAIEKDYSKYNSPAGLLELRKAICKKLEIENNLHYQPQDITVSSGAKHAFFNALNAVINPGDEILIFSPYWVTYPELVRLLGAVPKIIPTDAKKNFKPQAKDIAQYISPKTKAIVLNSPNNPSGTVIDGEELEKLGQIIAENDLYCLSDEIYESLVYGESSIQSPASLSREMYQRTIIINGVSKRYAMTGYRIGFTAAPTPIAKLITAFQGQSTHHPSLPSQYAALGAYEKAQSYIDDLRDSLSKRKELVESKLKGIEKLSFISPEGAFYFLLNISNFLNKEKPIKSSEEFCHWFLEKQKLALVPGSAFGIEGWARMSFTSDVSDLEKGLERLKTGLLELLGRSKN